MESWAESWKPATWRFQHYFVEQDQTPGDPLASLKESYSYLSKLNY